MILDRRELDKMLEILIQQVFPKDRSRWTA